MEMHTNTYVAPIRPTVPAVIVREGAFLVQIKDKPGIGPYFTLPGGKQEAGESTPDALRQECFEEMGANLSVGQLLHVAEVFKQKENGIRHQIELLFSCEVPEDYKPVVRAHPDPSQTGTCWTHRKQKSHLFRPAYTAALTANARFHLGVFND